MPQIYGAANSVILCSILVKISFFSLFSFVHDVVVQKCVHKEQARISCIDIVGKTMGHIRCLSRPKKNP